MKLQTLVTAIAFLVLTAGAHAAPPSDKWSTDYDAALKAAQTQSKPMLIMFSASWCPPCNMMKKDVLPQKSVQTALDKWVLAYIDVDENKALPNQYQIQAIPTFVMLDSGGRELGRFNYMQAGDFAGWINAVRGDVASLTEIGRRLEAKPNDAALLRGKGDVLADIGLRMAGVYPMTLIVTATRANEAIEAYKAAQAAGDNSPELRANIGFLGAVVKATKNESAAAAGQELERYAQENPNGKFAADALFWRAIAAAKMRQTEQSQALVREYGEKYPGGRYALIVKAKQ
ncbi:MAG: thioredoxin family protein [Candidatus Sumerlaeia bacterium]